MTNNWINRVTGQAVSEAVPMRRPSTLRKVIGEADDKKEEKSEKAESPAEPKEKKEEAPKSETPPAPATDKPKADGDEPGESEGSTDADLGSGADANAVDSQTVEHLVSSWESGSKMDVASQLMYTPVSYVDFVKMLYRIGEQDGVELGGMLDQLSEVRPSIDQPGGDTEGGGAPEAPAQGGSAERVLSRIAQRRQGGAPVAEPAGESTPELDSVP
jgi:hypothetical protein